MQNQLDALMNLLDLWPIVPLIWLYSRSKKGGFVIVTTGPTLVLKTFNIFTKGKDGVFIEIIGHPTGITSWLLTKIGLETKTTFMLMSDKLTYWSTGLRGVHHIIFPLPSIESTSCGYTKPIGLAIFGALIITVSLVSDLAFDKPRLEGAIIVMGLLFIANYSFSKKLYISATAGKAIIQISFKESVIENIPITLEKSLEAIGILNNIITTSQTKSLYKHSLPPYEEGLEWEVGKLPVESTVAVESGTFTSHPVPPPQGGKGHISGEIS